MALTYDQALANLKAGGLTGSALTMATTALKNAYATNPDLAAPRTINTDAVPAGTPTRSVPLSAPTPPTYQAPAFSTSPVSSPNNSAYTQFNTALMGLLKTQQSMGTKGFQTAGFNAEQKQNDIVLAPTSSSLIGAAPGLQNSVRSGQAEAIQPLVTGANNATQTFGEQIRSLGDAINAAKSFGDSYQAHQDNMKQQAQATITQAMNIGGAAALQAVQKANPDIFKTAGLDFDSLLAAAQAQEKYQNDLKSYDLQKTAYDDQQKTTTPTSITNTASGLETGKTFVSGTFKYTPTQYQQDKAALIATRGADGWVDPAVYLRGLKAWLLAGGVQSDYLQVYPIKDYINPANTWPAIIALGGGTKPKTTRTTTTSTRSA